MGQSCKVAHAAGGLVSMQIAVLKIRSAPHHACLGNDKIAGMALTSSQVRTFQVSWLLSSRHVVRWGLGIHPGRSRAGSYQHLAGSA
jgi:hypothetical protein